MKILNHSLLALLLFMLFAGMLSAQNREVTGTVTSEIDGQPLIGVSILAVGTRNGAISDLDGNFSVEVSSTSDSLRFTYTGFETQTVFVGAQSVLNVRMRESSSLVDEVVVVGYGSMRKSDLTGSVYSVKAKELIKNPDSNPLHALQGKVPGLQVSSVSGNPGESPVVRIRGVATLLGGASPVFVVDGIILDNISFLSSGDIASIEVLKDASATAIYGTRGANGVIIITTKRGEPGKPVLNARATYSLEYVPQKIDLLGTRDFANIVNELQPGRFNNIDALPRTNWQELILNEAAPIQRYELSASGGSDKYSYYFGGSYYDQQGVIEKSDYQRLSLKLNNSLQVTNFLKLGTDLSFSKEDKNNPPGIVAAAYRAWPTSEPTDANGNFLEVEGAGNPLASLAYSNNFSDRTRAVGNFAADVQILKGLSFRSSYQLDWQLFENTSFTPAFFVSPAQQNETSDLSKNDERSRAWIWENTLRYGKEFTNHRFDVLAGYTAQENNFERLRGTVENLIRDDPDFWYLDAGDATTLDAFNVAESFSYISYLFRLNYVFKDRYLFTGTFRRDGSSKFGPNNRYGNFPSAAIGWRITEEDFMQNQNLFDNLKFRASWGINGNDKINYPARFARVSSNDLEAVFGPDEDLAPGATLTDAGNPDLQWENTESLDIGFEFGLFNNRLTGEIDYYNKQTNKVLVPLLLPAHFGNGAFNRVVFNAADVKNSGFELYLNWRNTIGKFNYSVGLIGSTVKNEVLGLGAADEFITDGSLGNGQLVTRTETGNSIGAFYGYKVVGVFQDADQLSSLPVLAGQGVGDFRYQDTNNDGKINTEDRVYLGSYIPDFLAGLNLEVGYAGFELSVDIQGQFGNEIYNGKRAVRPELYNFESYILDRWTGPGTSNTQPRLSTGGLNFSPSDWFIEDGSFIRLRSVSLSYTPPRRLMERLKLRDFTVFVRGTNVYTMTDFSGYSPEIASQSALASGIDLGTYPVTATYSVGFNLSL